MFVLLLSPDLRDWIVDEWSRDATRRLAIDLDHKASMQLFGFPVLTVGEWRGELRGEVCEILGRESSVRSTTYQLLATQIDLAKKAAG